MKLPRAVPKHPLMKAPRITLCGSTKFPWAFEELNALLTREGWAVLSVSSFMHATGEINPQVKARLDQLHFQKIEMSEAVFVLDVGGYIGASTRNEIEHAKLWERKIYYLSEMGPELTEEKCQYSLSALLKKTLYPRLHHQFQRALFERDFWATGQSSFDVPEDSKEHPCTKAGHRPESCPDWGRR